MQDVNFSCCSTYVQCSDAGKCIKPEKMNNCSYWKRNLSQGRNFYSTKPKTKERNSYLYLINDGRAFRISASSNNYSYPLSQGCIEYLSRELKALNIEYTLTYQEYTCEITGTPQDPAYYRVIFKIGEYAYNVKNFNGFELTEKEAQAIANILPGAYSPEAVRWCSTGYFKMNISKVTAEPARKIKKENEIKSTRKVEAIHQLSLFEMFSL